MSNVPAPGYRQVELVGRKIRQLRKMHKLTQTELAGRIGIHQSDLSRMEKGAYRVSLDTLFRILAEFELSMGEFFGEVKKATATARDTQILHHLRSLNEDAQREIEEFIAFKRSQTSDSKED